MRKQILKRSRLIADKNINCFQPAGISFSETETANLRLKLKAIPDEKNNAQMNIDGKQKNESLSEESDAKLTSIAPGFHRSPFGIAHDYNNLLTAIIGNITLDRC